MVKSVITECEVGPALSRDARYSNRYNRKELKYSQIRAQKSFGLKFKSPKDSEKDGAKRENRPLMCDFGRGASPKDWDVATGSDIAAEHEIHAQNAENAGTHITGVFAREKPCSGYIGGPNDELQKQGRVLIDVAS